jgi:hypothetical protein
MRKPATWPSLIILALGASTAWLAYELHATRQELAVLRGSSQDEARTPAPRPVAAADEPAPAYQAMPAAAAAAAAAAAPAPEPARRPNDSERAQNDANMRAASLAHDAWVRTWIDDPEKRAKVSLDNRKNHERELPKQLLGLEDDDYNRLMDTMAASDLRYAEALYRCNTDPTCDINSVIGTEMKANKREMVELLGAEKAQWLENYRDNHMERNSVATFSSQMPESLRLSDEQAEKLAEALGDERRRIVKEWQQRGEQISGMANMYGSLNYPGSSTDVAQRVAEAAEFQRRQRNRAAQVLTPAQLEIFTKQQQQLLEIARGSWEYEDKATASR